MYDIHVQGQGVGSSRQTAGVNGMVPEFTALFDSTAFRKTYFFLPQPRHKSEPQFCPIGRSASHVCVLTTALSATEHEILEESDCHIRYM